MTRARRLAAVLAVSAFAFACFWWHPFHPANSISLNSDTCGGGGGVVVDSNSALLLQLEQANSELLELRRRLAEAHQPAMPTPQCDCQSHQSMPASEAALSDQDQSVANHFQDLAQVAAIFRSDISPPEPSSTHPHQIFIELGGHLRSQGRNLRNFESLVASLREQGGQAFVSEYTWSKLDDDTRATWWKHNEMDYVAEQTKIHGLPRDILSNLIQPALKRLQIPHLVVVGQSATERGNFEFNRFRSWLGAHRATRLLAQQEGVAMHPHDIVLSTRPDVLFVKSLKLAPLVAFLKRNPMTIFVISHERTYTGEHKNDPSDVTWITTVQAQDAFVYSLQSFGRAGPCSPGADPSLNWFQVLMFTCTPVTLRYIAPEMPVFLHRLHNVTHRFPQADFPYMGHLVVDPIPFDIVSTQVCKKPFRGFQRTPLELVSKRGKVISTLSQLTHTGNTTVEVKPGVSRRMPSLNLDDGDDGVPLCPFIDRVKTEMYGAEGFFTHGEAIDPQTIPRR
ncbi:hypothetical protein CAOG_07332 [Capsaspora owczarzaki ATCC 30864]|uniref:Uncharacterized protein n=1 Tax=Capsaspora owczarzaki (strain ATCC 30864) TaxID=595528 RepID=A0A0D2UR45_CAPO3|nr:hypothetical protein CAOG_07332 [Capsaspora owczarzaki ATCC 30864]KJE97481.1 hypothetical protein CAOG_007332 [Capsaspora owczarzaki ATCC 30864]|eukprot:XP_004343191.1 hypothetical protein CAOG_07332 [Capsaspora owczarzaki ATCC 30864]